MIIPVRCFTCGKVMADKWEPYQNLCKSMSRKQALDKLGLVRYCCRRTLLTHVDVIDEMLEFEPIPNCHPDCLPKMAEGKTQKSGVGNSSVRRYLAR